MNYLYLPGDRWALGSRDSRLDRGSGVIQGEEVGEGVVVGDVWGEAVGGGDGGVEAGVGVS